jgi:hypothetical protein
MKVLFSADWHIKLGQKNVPREWQKNRFHSMFKKLHEIEKDVDLNVVGGDVFDKVPNLEEWELFFDYLSGRVSPPQILYPSALKSLNQSLGIRVEGSRPVRGCIKFGY